jgi:pyruvate dehydrogenase E2 component (dihydrolipoamide acetyltransferase)
MIIGSDGEDISGLIPQGSAESKPTPVEKPAEIAAQPQKAEPAKIAPPDGEIKISPRAKQYAKQAKADLSKAIPTGPDGRIIERDVIELVSKGHRLYAECEMRNAECEMKATTSEGKENAALYTDVKLPNIRKIIAKSMQASLSEMAQLTLNSSFDASVILAFRKNLKDNAQALALENITLNDIVLYAAAKTLKKHKDANAHYLGELGVIRYFEAVNLGVAVDTERGLLVPTIFGADNLSLNELAKQTKKTIGEAQSGSIHPDKLKGGTFTITNLGALGVESFTPVINPPQTCILGVNNITRRIKQIDGRDVFYDCMGLSLTFDHRALDGAPAAKFLKDLCSNLENFDLLLAK